MKRPDPVKLAHKLGQHHVTRRLMVGDRVESMAGSPLHPTGHIGTVTAFRRDGVRVQWDTGGKSTIGWLNLRLEESV